MAYRIDSIDPCDVVIIGSGFGGSVMALRLAEAGKSVRVFERGKKYGPGDFSRTPREMHENFWRPSKRHYGLFDVWSFGAMQAVVSAGLGGGSLIYANVLIRKDENWFVRDGRGREGYEQWPVTRACLEPHYDAVEKRLQPQVFPVAYRAGNKAAAMVAAAKRLNIEATEHDRVDPAKAQFYFPLLAVTFQNGTDAPAPGETIPEAYPNIHNKKRQTCRLCGECDVGCNYGSKNTLDYTYLSEACRLGAHVHPLCEVEEIEPRDGGDGYRVTYIEHDVEDGHRPKDRLTVSASRVVIAAGALGSTLLLLRNARHLRNLSPALGTRFSANGDYLAFASSTEFPLNASRTPVITSTFRFPDATDGAKGSRGRYLQDAGYPLAGDYIWELTDPLRALKRGAKAVARSIGTVLFGTANTEIGGEIGKLIGGGRRSLSSMPLLGMGRDVPNGTFRLGWRRRLQLHSREDAAQGFYTELDRDAKRVAKAMGGRYVQNPLTRLFNDLITVHPLGGAPMGTDPRHGVVDAYGEVFGHPGLYVADGSVMPGPVGANPSLTIAALADRFAERMIEKW